MASLLILKTHSQLNLRFTVQGVEPDVVWCGVVWCGVVWCGVM